MQTIKLLALIMIVLVLAIIALANTAPSFPMFRLINQLPGTDKLGHFLIMGTLSFFVVLAFSYKRGYWHLRRSLIVMGLLGVAIGLEELSQSLLPTRTMSLTDLLASWAGLLFFGILALGVLKILFVSLSAPK